jgi:hypothetical protein
MATGDAILISVLLVIALALTTFIFIFKKQYWSMLAAIFWIIPTYNRFGAAVKQWDTNYNLGYFGMAMIVFCLTTLFWAFKVVPEKKSEVVEDDYWTKKEKRAAEIRKRRPKRYRNTGPWDIG